MDTIKENFNLRKILKSKIAYVVLAIIAQALFIVFAIFYFSSHFFLIYLILVLASFLTCIHVINRDSDSSSKLLWVLAIMTLPFFGCIIYLFFGNKKIPKELQILDRQAEKDYDDYIRANEITTQENPDDLILQKMVNMAWNNGKFRVYEGCNTLYFPSGEAQYNAMIKELQNAKAFIFIEFFIINKSMMWDTILQILLDKVEEGVDVRLIYDDFGCIGFYDNDYANWLNSKGIKTHVFNPIKPQLAIQMNNRDHRKIVVIDGHTAFTGGCNISDEYINTKKRFGYWKDMGMMIQGQAVETFTISFLQIWNYQEETKTHYEPFILPSEFFQNFHFSGYVLPFFDSPTDDKYIGKNMHMNMMQSSVDYLWISTPYLILDSEMVDSLTLAVDNGADVRIVVPGIPDKKMVYEVTKQNIDSLVHKGVKVYEYTPGFIHGKVCLSDDSNAMVGTVNMDFRSYYLHYECGVWMKDTRTISKIKKDFENIFADSHLVTVEECDNVNSIIRFSRRCLKIVSPLL